MKALFITIADLKAKSIIDGNTDADKLIHYIEVAQDMHVQNYLGGKIDNGGVSKHRSESADTLDFREVDRMTSKVTDRAEFYTKRFLDYICFNTQKFPEYNNNSNGDMYPDKDANGFSSWVL